MNPNFYSAFARVTETGDGNQSHSSTYGHMPFNVQQIPNVFPSTTSSATSLSRGNNSQSRGSNSQTTGNWGQQTPSAAHSQSRSHTAIQSPNNAGINSHPVGSFMAQEIMVPTGHIPTGSPGHRPVPAVYGEPRYRLGGSSQQMQGGTPLLEWNGREWVAPQQCTIDAVSAQGSVQVISNSSVPTTYTSLNWNDPQPAHGINTSSQFTELTSVPPAKRGRKTRKPQPTRQGHEAAEAVATITVPSDQPDILSPQPLARPKGRRSQAVYTTNASAGASDEARAMVQALAHVEHHEEVVVEMVATSPPKPPRPPKPFDGRYATCTNCGTLSSDYLDCESCHTELPDDVKMYDPEAARKAEQERKEQQRKQATEKLLLHKLKLEQERKRQQAELAAKAAAAAAKAAAAHARLVPKRSGSPRKTPGKPGQYLVPIGKRTARRKASHSEDDDWMPNEEGVSGGGLTRRGRGRPKGGKQATEVYVLSSNSETESEEEAYVPAPTKRTAAAQASKSRGAPTSANASPVAHKPSAIKRRSSKGQELQLYVRCVRITMGTLTGAPKEPLHIALTGIDINMETDTESVKIRLDNRDIKEVLGCIQKNLAVLFIRANNAFGVKVRTALQMTGPAATRYYDPETADLRYRYIVVHLDTQHQITNLASRMNEVFRAISLSYQTGGVLFRFVELSTASRLLALTHGEECDMSSSQLLEEIEAAFNDGHSDEERTHEQFTGPIKQLFPYPFPPARANSWITNQDKFCLNDGEFLNDTIITFYLNYLTESILSPEDKERTHIFNTFFYTKLTQKINNTKDGTKKTAAEKRHHRVKSWTKSVDLFSKDFVIVPINEMAHWFVAVICYPSLLAPVYADGGNSGSEDQAATDQPAAQDASTNENPDGKVSTNQEQASAALSSQGQAMESTANRNVVNEVSTNEATEGPTKPVENKVTGDGVTSTTNENDAFSSEPATSASEPEAISSTGDITHSASSTDSTKLVPPPAATSDEGSTAPSASTEAALTALPAASADQGDNESESSELCGFEFEEDEVGNDSVKPGRKITRRPCILIFDSLMMPPGQNTAIRRLREYLSCEWLTKQPNKQRLFTKDTFPGSNSKCPQQNNYSDCGVYLLQYVENFFKNPIQDFNLPMTWTVNWFDQALIRNKRNDLKTLIDSTTQQYEIIAPPRPTPKRGRPRRSTGETPEKKNRTDSMQEVTTKTPVPEALGLSLTIRLTDALKEMSKVPNESAVTQSDPQTSDTSPNIGHQPASPAQVDGSSESKEEAQLGQSLMESTKELETKDNAASIIQIPPMSNHMTSLETTSPDQSDDVTEVNPPETSISKVTPVQADVTPKIFSDQSTEANKMTEVVRGESKVITEIFSDLSDDLAEVVSNRSVDQAEENGEGVAPGPETLNLADDLEMDTAIGGAPQEMSIDSTEEKSVDGPTYMDTSVEEAEIMSVEEAIAE